VAWLPRGLSSQAMALPHAAESSSTVEAGEPFEAGPRLPLGTVVPLVDATALLMTTAAVGSLDALGLVYSLCAFLILRVLGPTRARINPLLLRTEVFQIVGWLAVPVVLFAPFAPSVTEVGQLAKLAGLATLALLIGRGVAYKTIRDARARGIVRESTLIVGAGQVARRVARTLQQHREFGLVPIGFLDSVDDTDLELPILGDASDLERIVLQFRVKRVIVAFGATTEPEMVKIIRTCDRLPVEMYVMPRFFELGVGPESAATEDLWGIPLMQVRRAALRTFAWRTKRMFDLVVGTLLLILVSPVFLAAALAVRLSSDGPVFFTQLRVGQRGHLFGLLKFRTMVENDDSDTTWSVAKDDRVTPVGRILRRTSIDELPQLINVLKGEMSLVGPRPERPFFVDQFRVGVHGYDDRHRVPAGMTGWAQVHGLRGDTSLEERALFDNYYVEHWSLWRDMMILARTVWVVLRGQGR
jgi:exopolysaccharide biosynthesis polyprenyl glycosylphosphotransferase